MGQNRQSRGVAVQQIEAKAAAGGAMDCQHCFEGLRFLIERVEGGVTIRNGEPRRGEDATDEAQFGDRSIQLLGRRRGVLHGK